MAGSKGVILMAEETNDFSKYLYDLDQVGMITSDMDANKEQMKRIFGWEPDNEFQRVFHLKYRGEETEATARICSYRKHKVEIEFIEPIGEGKTAWHDYLKMGKSGIHHIRYNVPDFWATRQAFLDKGVDIWIEGKATGPEGLQFAYFDTLDELGYVIEIINWHEIEDKQ